MSAYCCRLENSSSTVTNFLRMASAFWRKYAESITIMSLISSLPSIFASALSVSSAL